MAQDNAHARRWLGWVLGRVEGSSPPGGRRGRGTFRGPSRDAGGAHRGGGGTQRVEPGPGFATGLHHHPATHGHDQPGVFGERDEEPAGAELHREADAEAQHAVVRGLVAAARNLRNVLVLFTAFFSVFLKSTKKRCKIYSVF